MDGNSVLREYSNGQASNHLINGICLVACKSKQATPFLQLHDNGPILEPLKFASKLLGRLDAAMKANLESDRVTKIQILALMHLHNDGLGGVDRSSSYLSQAICEAWSLSLHLRVPGNPDHRDCDFLWWALRNFDRLNKPIMGAGPFMVDDTDIAISRIESCESDYRSQLMSVSLALGDLMTTATKVYKASSTATVDDGGEFPSLSEITSSSSLDRFHKSHAAYLELWYHLAAMLSCRYSGPGKPQYSRRLASADRTLNIISTEGSERLPPLPLIPYAISMATTVIYRALRDGRRDAPAACQDLNLCCNALDILSHRWTTVKGVARLARRLLRFIERGEPQPSSSENIVCTCRAPGTPNSPEKAENRLRSELVSAGQDLGASPEAPRTYAPTATQEAQTRQGEEEHMFRQQFGVLDSDLWESVDLSYHQLDRAFYDMFGDGMPDIFRDPTTLDFLHTPTGNWDSTSTV